MDGVEVQPKVADVQLWMAAHEKVGQSELQRFKSWFTVAEGEQFSKFLSERRQKEFIIGRGLARTALGGLFDVQPQQLQFSADDHGKLTIKVPDRARSAHFSISHTHDIVVVALCKDFPVGVDVERTVDRIDPMTLAERFYSKSEYEVLTKLESVSRRDRFYLMWTLKEALAKAHGLGVLSGTDNTHFDIVPGNSLLALCWDSHFREAWVGVSKPSRQHHLALCVLGNNSMPVRIRIEHDQTGLDGLSNLDWFEGRLENRSIQT